jgi:hypothetical protein
MRGELFAFAAVFATSGVGIAWLDWFLRALTLEVRPAAETSDLGERSSQERQQALVHTQEELLQVPLSGSSI